MKKNGLDSFCQGKTFLLIPVFLLLFSELSPAQTQSFQIDREQPVQVAVTGGSTLHDWTVTCEVVQDYPSNLELTVKEGGEIESFAFSVEVKSMEGGRGSIMNTKIFNALKAEEHPYIKYRQTAPAKLGPLDSDGKFQLVSRGVLQMAGEEKEVSVDVSGQYKDGALTFTAGHPMKMSDFKIEQPSAMFGQIQTKDDITVNFDFRYQLKK